MDVLIRVGGVSVILAVLGICVFILAEILPLLRGARVTEVGSHAVPPRDYAVLACDQWLEKPVLIERGTGAGVLVDLKRAGEVQELPSPFPAGQPLTALVPRPADDEVLAGTADGQVAILQVRYERRYRDNRPTLECRLTAGPFVTVGAGPVSDAAGNSVRQDEGSAGPRVLAAIWGAAGERQVSVVVPREQRGLLGGGELTASAPVNLTPQLAAAPTRVLLSASGDVLLVADAAGNLNYFQRREGEFTLVQRVAPFGDLPEPAITELGFIFGDTSVVALSASGACRGFSLYVPDDHTQRLFSQTKTFAPLPERGTVYARSVRNKAFLISDGRRVRLCYGTSAATRWQAELPYQLQLAAVAPRYDALLFVGDDARLRVARLNDPYPEAGLRAFFAPLWYEGRSRPEYVWQSSGSTDDAEPKLSMMPLVFGTLKGTLYAMLFAAPLALLAALYTSQFQHGRFRQFVKPTMEIMASLPSVVLGFLAALWLAPLLENRVPAIVVFVVLLPLAALLLGWAWGLLPQRRRALCPEGWEFLPFMPVIVLCWLAASHLGPGLERLVFVVHDPATGAAVADFRHWWPAVTRTPFEQRNALVVGFMMGFAVIPIVFTIAEDALSNVPRSIVSASTALGATRWQTAIRVVLPTASAGVFSAIMMGLGRAVGETMIVLMATGNTPIMEWNLFSGMRTLSANIAVELPEAPQGQTLYRTLFLGALLLFLLTFVINTFAELLRHHLRTKYRTI